MPQRMCYCAEYIWLLGTIVWDCGSVVILNPESFGGRANPSEFEAMRRFLGFTLPVIFFLTILDATGCPKVMVCYVYHVCRMEKRKYFFLTFFFIVKKLILFQYTSLYNIIIGITRYHNLIIMCLCIVATLQHHMTHTVVNIFLSEKSGLKVNCEHFRCNYVWTHMSQSLYDACNVGTVHNMYLIRYWSPAELRRRAIQQTLDERALSAREKSLILVPHIEGVWNGSDARLTKESVAVAVAGQNAPSKRRSQSRSTADNDHMAAWLKAVGPTASLTDPGLVPFEDMIPSGAPLIDFLSLDSERDDTWTYPSWDTVRKWRGSRSITPEWASKVIVKEFVVGYDSEEKFGSFKADFWRRYQRDQDEFPTGVISFDTESVPCTTHDVVRVAENPETWVPLTTLKEKEGLHVIPVSNKPSEKETGYQFPAKIMFGGSDWVHMISFNAKKDSKGRSCVKAGVVPQYVVDFIEELPVVTGAGVHSDMLDVEHVFTVLSSKPVRMKGSLDLGSLAVLAGWQLSKTGMLPLAVITLGMMMNKVVSIADWKWARRWCELPSALQAYAVGDIKMGYLTYNVLMALLHRQLFPDPELVCRLSRCTQEQWTSWFTHVIRDTLVGAAVDAVHMPAAIKSGSRAELMLCIRVRDKDGAIPLEAPARIKFLAGLVVWPTLTMGGPRYLHCVRHKYLGQYSVLLKSIAFPGMDQFFKHEVTPMDRLDAVYGHEDVVIVNEDMAVPFPGYDVFHMGMVFHPHLESSPFQFQEPGEVGFLLSISRLKKAAKSLGTRGLREGMLEWTRLSYVRSENLFEAMRESDPLARYFKGWYEAFRLQYLRGTGRALTPVPWVEDAFNYELEDTRKQAAARYELIMKEMEVHKRFMKALEDTVSTPLMKDRTSWRDCPTAALWLRGDDDKRACESSAGEPAVKKVRLMSEVEALKMDSQAVKLGKFVAETEYEALSPLVHFRDSDECTDGGRRTTGRVKAVQQVLMNPLPVPPVFGESRRVVLRQPSAMDTQDVWEEFKRPEVPDPFDDFEDFDEFMPSPPSLPFDLADQ